MNPGDKVLVEGIVAQIWSDGDVTVTLKDYENEGCTRVFSKSNVVDPKKFIPVNKFKVGDVVCFITNTAIPYVVVGIDDLTQCLKLFDVLIQCLLIDARYGRLVQPCAVDFYKGLIGPYGV